MIEEDAMTIQGVAANRAVFVNRKRLDPAKSLALINHSPTGFCWGYGGSGPAQLALAILLEVTGDEAFALRHYQQFKWDCIAILPMDADFDIPMNRVLEWAQKQPPPGSSSA